MKSACAIAGVLVVVGALAASAAAGDYHTNATLLCSQCHVMHYSQQHGYSTTGTGFFLQPGSGGPFPYLLRSQVNELCLACHDQAGIAPDVLGSANGGNGPTDVRLAGYLNRLGATGEPATGHTLDAVETAPGSDPPWKPEDENGSGRGLSCINCHHQHGYAGGQNAYRNLRMDPGNQGFLGAVVTYNHGSVGTNDLTRDVFERQKAEYDESVVDWNEPDDSGSAIATWCAGCHGEFHGAPGDPGTVGGEPAGAGFVRFLRHPAAGVDIGAVGGGHSSLAQFNQHVNKVKVMSAVGVWSPAGGDVTPTCISCHKAHGNGRAFGLIYRSGSGTKTENGDSNGTQLEHLCGQCHVQAEIFVNP